LNVIEGTYPTKPSITKGFGQRPEDVFIAGNEAVAEVVQVGSEASERRQPALTEGDWVVMKKPQSGTWANWKVVHMDDIIKIPKKREGSKVTEVFGATLMVGTFH
jgi:trans-2-enoyl-CoA reductase